MRVYRYSRDLIFVLYRVYPILPLKKRKETYLHTHMYIYTTVLNIKENKKKIFIGLCGGDSKKGPTFVAWIRKTPKNLIRP